MCGKCWVKGIISVIASYLLIVVLLFSLKSDVNIYTFSLILLVLLGISVLFCPIRNYCSMMPSEKMPAKALPKKAAKKKR